MDCEKVRDQFSSLWEKELTPPDEKIIREHLSSCQGCQKEFEGFEKTMKWLRSAGEVELPDGFLPELRKKMEERKGKALPEERARGRWLGFPLFLKLPVQAVAMVAIVFLVLYLAKLMPTEVYRLKDGKQTAPSLSAEKKPEQVLAQKGVEKERGAVGTTAETPREKDIEQTKTSLLGEEKLKEENVPLVGAEAKKMEIPAPGTGVMGYRTFDSKEAARPQVPSPEPGKIEGRLAAKGKSIVASKPPREITLRVSDREKVTSMLYELVKQFGGEIVTSEGNILLVSLPAGSSPEFEKEAAGLSPSTKADKDAAKKQVLGSARATPGGKREEADEKSEEPAKLAPREEGRIAVRIFLIQE
jgi:predicted anti-sigma-YlaC factor YlaD